MRLLRYDPLQAPAKIEPKVGGLYSIYDGAISGEFVRVDHEHIELKWRMKNWAPACFSTVTIKNTPRGALRLLAARALVPAGRRLANLQLIDLHAFKFNAAMALPLTRAHPRLLALHAVSCASNTTCLSHICRSPLLRRQRTQACPCLTSWRCCCSLLHPPPCRLVRHAGGADADGHPADGRVRQPRPGAAGACAIDHRAV